MLIGLHILMRPNHEKDAARDDLKKFARIHILLLQLSGLLDIGHGRICKLAANLILGYTHLTYFLLTSTYVLSVLAGNNDATNIGECVCVLCIHWRYIVLYRHRNDLPELLQISYNLWAVLSDSEKVIVR